MFGMTFTTHFIGARDGQPVHLLGTDKLGRDILSRGIVGSQISLALAIGCVALITLIGTFAGITSGYLGGASIVVPAVRRNHLAFRNCRFTWR